MSVIMKYTFWMA